MTTVSTKQELISAIERREKQIIATGEIDFSIGPVMFCAALIGGKLFVDGVPMGACLIITILVCNTLVNKITGASLDEGIGG